MEFRLTEDQLMLRDLVDRLCAEQHGFDARRAAIASADGLVPGFWPRLSELGLIGAALTDAAGGSGGGGVEAMLIHMALGRNLVISPYLPTTLGARFLAATKGPAAEGLPAVLEGRHTLALALTEDLSLDLNAITTSATEDKDGYVLNGKKPAVMAAPWCDSLIVAARLARKGDIGVFLTPARAPGVHMRALSTINGSRAADIQFDNVQLPKSARIGAQAKLGVALEKLFDEGAVALCAEACGAIDVLHESTVAYAKMRKQFGKPIGRFQALQHRMVDMLVMREQAVSITHRAALALNEATPDRQRFVSAAKAHVGRVGRLVAQAAVQIHGGIGVTEELDISHHFRSIEAINLQFGSVDAHQRRYEQLLFAYQRANPASARLA